MRFAILPFLAAALGAAPASAASALVTPALQPSAAGMLACWVVNASDTKALEVEVEIRTFMGGVAASATGTVEPGRANSLFSDNDAARFCVVRVVRGGKRNAIVSLVALEGNVTVAAVRAVR